MLLLGDKKMVKNKCTRCGHEWVQRKIIAPKTCPKCKSPYWNKQKQTKIKVKK